MRPLPHATPGEPETIQTLRERLAYSRRAFGDASVRELLPEEIGRWNASLRLAPTTRGHALRAMRQVLAAGVRWGYLERNPAGHGAVPMPTSPAKEVYRRALEDGDVAVNPCAGIRLPASRGRRDKIVSPSKRRDYSRLSPMTIGRSGDSPSMQDFVEAN